MPGTTLILGIGNPGRKDDGLGPVLAQHIQALGMPGVDTDAGYQLNVEDGAAITGYDAVVFVDASRSGPEPFYFEPVARADEVAFTSHSVSPGAVLTIAKDHFGGAPEAWVLGVRGYSFNFEEGLTSRAEQNVEKALAFVRSWLTERGG